MNPYKNSCWNPQRESWRKNRGSFWRNLLRISWWNLHKNSRSNLKNSWKNLQRGFWKNLQKNSRFQKNSWKIQSRISGKVFRGIEKNAQNEFSKKNLRDSFFKFLKNSPERITRQMFQEIAKQISGEVLRISRELHRGILKAIPKIIPPRTLRSS